MYEPTNPPIPYAEDNLRGAARISEYLGCSERRVYNLAKTRALPFHYEGATLCLLKSAHRRQVAAQQSGIIASAAE